MMAQKRWALSLPLDGFTLAEHADIAREAEGRGYTDAWSLEIDGVDCFAPLAVAGMATDMRLGTAIANVFTRGPATLASSAAGLAEIAPGRFCLGIGSGSQPIVQFWNGGVFSRPATRVREMAQVLRQAFAGERVMFQGETLQVNGFRLSRPVTAPIPIHVAALRPGMLQVAGEVGDGAIINWLSVEDVTTPVQIVRQAAAQAGRDPDALEITARLMVHIDPPDPESDQFARRDIAAYMNVPVYKAFQQWIGRGALLAPMWEAWEQGDRRGALAAIPDKAVQELTLRGSMADIRAHVQRYLDAGVDTAFLHLQTMQHEPQQKREAILHAIRSLAPGP
jgi:probable F420-dependent oxidoreductase